MDTSISDTELESINQAIMTRYGLDFSQYEASSIKRRISRIISRYQLKGVYGLWEKLLYDPAFIHTFRDEISVGLTEMFRNPDMWQYLKNLIQESGNENLSFWHAGISTGEEVYSMAITLHEAHKLQKSKILATDLSQKFVNNASKGEYELDSLKKYERNYQEYNSLGNFANYVTTSSDSFVVRNFLKSNIHFNQHNLFAEGPDENFDWIICRNVMIYFNDSLKLKALDKFASLLKPNGFLIIGYFDAMPENYENYFSFKNHGFKILQKV